MSKIADMMCAIPDRWAAMSLARQFAIACFFTLLIGMVTTASWVSNRIQNGVVDNSAVSTALYMESIIAPLVQGIGETNQISVASREAIKQLIDETPLGEQVVSYKIWGKGGVVIHSNNPDLIGMTFPVTDSLQAAWNGTVRAEYNNLQDEEDLTERALNVPLLETYSPIRDRAGKVVAVSEFYGKAEQLEKDLFLTRLQSWLLFGIAGLTMFAALTGIVLRGNRIINSQQLALEKRVAELSDLRLRLQRASRRSTELNESFLRRVGADLHDGPAQFIAFALLKIEDYTAEPKTATDRVALGKQIEEPLRDALAEIRTLSGGLTLPGFDGLTTREVLEKAAQAHVRRTGMQVQMDIDQTIETSQLPKSILICVYRFVQETLNNSLQHGQTNKASLTAKLTHERLTAIVADRGVGFNPAIVETRSEGLGLPGLRERIESVGGTFIIRSKCGIGTIVCASFNLDTHSELGLPTANVKQVEYH